MLFYFSGTGNSLQAARAVAQADERAFAAAVLDVFRRVTADPATPVPSVAIPYDIRP